MRLNAKRALLRYAVLQIPGESLRRERNRVGGAEERKPGARAARDVLHGAAGARRAEVFHPPPLPEAPGPRHHESAPAWERRRLPRGVVDCDSVLSDISGIEQCHRLQRIYAFDNIISSGAPLEALTDLKELWIQDNCLTDLSFLHSLSNLNVLKIGGKQLSDMTIRTVLEWPGKLQTLNAASDSRKSLQSLIPLEECSMLRKVNLGGDSEGYFMWIGCHFPFLEYLDDDKLEDKFVPFYLVSFLWSNEF
ncbi:hypothetical protein L596_012133 [Steinernema carpocapsae]|uniref:Dynein assembly factor 1, axonemal homolog n=1 Tax=Steinernema carpocapsae TaxID=34508 RepID=A0A4U5NWD1_STECR|nr:hypothetical protein L596_012133 [Steinernema carpocapsae]